MPELSVNDFSFNGRLGSAGTTISRVGKNHFHIALGQAPCHPEWFNQLQFEILRNAKGNQLRLDVSFTPKGETSNNIRFNHDASTWSYDGRNWMPILWKHWNEPVTDDTLVFPEFTQDRVYFGAQIPISYEEVVEFMERYGRHPHATVHVIGQSTGGRNIYRLEISDPKSPVPRSERWGFHANQQHCGEHQGQWRMIGMIDWLLSDAGADFRRRSVWHFVLEMDPDAPSQGWYRVSSAGVDLNRAYLIKGADPAKQPHESYVLQKDFEALMASETPITAFWSMHSWPGLAAPFATMGPKINDPRLGPLTELCALIARLDKNEIISPMGINKSANQETICWHDGPTVQFGITSFLCEGSDFWTDKSMSLEVGRIFIEAMAGYYKGARR